VAVAPVIALGDAPASPGVAPDAADVASTFVAVTVKEYVAPRESPADESVNVHVVEVHVPATLPLA